MAKPTLDEIKFAADEYVKLGRRVAREEKKREDAIEPLIKKHAREMEAACGKSDRKIEQLESQRAKLKAVIGDFLAGKTKTYSAEGEVAVFGVEVGSKPGMREPDKEKLRALCKRKGVDYDAITNVLLGEADKALGEAEVTAISTRSSNPTRDTFIRAKV